MSPGSRWEVDHVAGSDAKDYTGPEVANLGFLRLFGTRYSQFGTVRPGRKGLLRYPSSAPLATPIFGLSRGVRSLGA